MIKRSRLVFLSIAFEIVSKCFEIVLKCQPVWKMNQENTVQMKVKVLNNNNKNLVAKSNQILLVTPV